jgi:hypothetical protein
MELKHPTWHEAGHVVVGLHLGFVIESVAAIQGKLGTMCQLEDPARPNEERCLFLAGGIAGEKYGTGSFEPEPSRKDQERITEFGGAQIETYLTPAIEIVSSYDEGVRQFQKAITIKVIERTMEMSFGGTNSFTILPHVDIERIWRGCQPLRK